MDDDEELDVQNEEDVDINDIFLNNLNSTLFIKRDYDMKEFDYEWLEIIEDTLPYIDNILRNPKRFIINEEDIVKVELARRVTVESVIHLTQHTNLIQKIEDNGDVKPSKILNINREESLDTYENRFIFTLINNLRTFYESRLEATAGDSYCIDKNVMKYEANTKINNENIKVSININDNSRNLKESGSGRGEMSLEERFKKVKFQLDGFNGSELYQTLAKLHVPPVRSPIRKTNVILKNPNFRKAEALWNYIQSFESKDKKEKDKRNFFDNGLLKTEYDQACLMTFIANKNLITTSSGTTESNMINQMMIRLIDNLLDTDEDLDEDKLKVIFAKQADILKEKNKKKAKSVSKILDDRLDRENNSIKEMLALLGNEVK